jgi:cohesin domain-containing protein
LRVRKLLLFGALAGIVGFLLLDKPARTPEAAAVKSDGTAQRANSTDGLQVPGGRGLARARGELFGAPPPPPQAAPTVVAAAVAVAPPMPYRFAGRVLRGSEEEVLVSKGDLVFPVKVGDTLDGMYKVESIGADRIELLYIPLGTSERLLVSSALETARAPAAVAAAPAVAPSLPVADGKPAQLRWEGPALVQAGANFSVALRVNTQEPLRAAPMQLRFEPGVLEPVSVRPGKFFGDGNFSYRVNAAGSIFVGASSELAPPGVDAELVIVTFKPIKRGATAELSMSTLSLQGVAGRAIAHEQPSAFRAAIQ